jgi:hypothetical protein
MTIDWWTIITIASSSSVKISNQLQLGRPVSFFWLYFVMALGHRASRLRNWRNGYGLILGTGLSLTIAEKIVQRLLVWRVLAHLCTHAGHLLTVLKFIGPGFLVLCITTTPRRECGRIGISMSRDNTGLYNHCDAIVFVFPITNCHYLMPLAV